MLRLPPVERPKLRRLAGRDPEDDNRHNFQDLPEQDTANFGGRRPRSPCEISNDPDDEVLSPLAICNVTKYLCDNHDADREDELMIEVSFNYDIYAFNNTIESDAVSFVEEMILRETAQALGVDDCRMFFNRRQRGLFRGLQTLGHLGVSGIEADPTDTVRMEPCSSTFEEVSPETTCIPVVGGFSVYSDSKSGLRLELLDFVEDRINDDAFILDSYIQKVIYTGANLPPATVSPSPTQSPGPTSSSAPTASSAPTLSSAPSTPGAPGEKLLNDDPTNAGQGEPSDSVFTRSLIVGAAILAFMVLAVLFVVRRHWSAKHKKHRNNQHVRSLSLVDEPEFDVTDNLDSAALANKDSLALAPQPHEDPLETDSAPSRHLFANATNNDDTGFVDHALEPPGETDDESIYFDQSTENDESVSYRVGKSLSFIEENEVQDTSVEDNHNLDFEDVVSTTSFDTRQSARRVLQMT